MVEQGGQQGGQQGGDVDRLEDKVEEGETLEELLRRAIRGMSQLWTVVVVAILLTLLTFLAVGAAIFIVWNDNEEDNLHSCQRGNSRAADLVAFADKVQEIAGGPGASEKIDELTQFARDEFVQRDCTGDGEVTDADRPAGERAG